ncbi:hypothetical protein BC940DRAFT_340219 [Gongronella butleri]|nr:hypothetical protein BC940DRAFT_340219 [Gongronella butleri]
MSSSATTSAGVAGVSGSVGGAAMRLQAFLSDAPGRLSKLSARDEQLLLTSCYRSLWGDRQDWLQQYFFKQAENDDASVGRALARFDLLGSSSSNSSGSNHSHRDDDPSVHGGDDAAMDDEPEYWETQRGKQCGHLFKKGETVYRCRNCGLDDTCVLCSRCFHATDHEGHDVKMWLGQGTGGCCDCGDPEAWKVPLSCRIHSLDALVDDKGNKVVLPTMEPLESVPLALIQAVEDTLSVVFDYVLSTFAASPEKVSAGDVQQVVQETQASHAALNIPGNANGSNTYACVLWNDERHSFEQVIDIVMKATLKSKAEAQRDAEQVDQNGRHVVFCSNDVKQVTRVAREISTINLAVTVRSQQNTVREDICGVLLQWLKSLISGRLPFFASVQGGSSILRDAICKVLCMDWQLSPVLATLSTTARRERRLDHEESPDDNEFSGPDLDMTDDGGGNGLMDVEQVAANALAFLAPLEFPLDDDDEEDDEQDMMMNASDVDEIILTDHDMDYQDADDDSEDIEEHDDDDDNDDPMDYQSAEEASEWLAPSTNDANLNQDTPAGPTLTRRRRRRASSSSSSSSLSSMSSSRIPQLRTARFAPNTVPVIQLARQARAQQQEQHTQPLNASTTTPPPPPPPSARRRSSSNHPTTHSSSSVQDIVDLSYDLDAWLAAMEQKEKAEIERNEALLGMPVFPPSPSSFRQVNTSMKAEFKRKLRLDYLLQFDLRLWKLARTCIKDLLIGTLISNFDYRPILGIRLARNYPDLVDAFFFKDREPEHSITSLSVQLLTVPTVAWMLVKQYRFFGIVCSLLSNFFLTDHVHMVLPERYRTMQVDCRSRSITRHRYAFTFFDLRYVLNADLVKSEVTKDPLYLRSMMDMLYQFQAMDPLVRQRHTHVEYESNSWVSAFNVTLQIAKICHMFAECFSSEHLSSHDHDTLVAASRSLCRSIYRVLDEITRWQPQKSTELQSTLGDASAANNGAPQVLIRGARDQQFKQVHTPHAGSFNIVDYDVTREPVSFHHPFHWLLSELLEHVTLLRDDLLVALGLGQFKQMIARNNHSDKDNDLFLTLLDYPLRTIVLLSQINCGVWVRNGYGVRNQARTYKDISVRGNTYDRDIYLLQAGFVATDPDHLLVTMLDRFKLYEWFSGKVPQHMPGDYEATQLLYMVEEFLGLLVICATERGYASAMSVEHHIRRYIIQYLGIATMSHSELVKLVPEHLHEHEAFESTLLELATYKPPDGLNDHGVYELKDPYYDDLDPYFWHFTRNHREEAFDALRKHRPHLTQTDPAWAEWLSSSSSSSSSASSPSQKAAEDDHKKNKKDELIVLPRLVKVPFGPFTRLGEFLQSSMLCQIVLHALWHMKTSAHPSDTVLESALYLAMLAAQDDAQNKKAGSGGGNHKKSKGKQRASSASTLNDNEEHEPMEKGFFYHATKEKHGIRISAIEREPATLLTVLLRCLSEKHHLEHIHKRLYFIVDLIEKNTVDDAAVQQAIADWRETAKALHAADAQAASNGPSEYERKKAAAKARQAAIMSQFAQAQSQFLSQHGDLYGEDDDDNDHDHLDDHEALDEGLDHPHHDQQQDQDAVQRLCHFPSGTCIVCQEELGRNGLVYGMLGLVQHSHVMRHTPLKQPDILVDVCDTILGDNCATKKMASSSSPAADAQKTMDLHGFPIDASASGLHVSSCGHLMHAECFDNYQSAVEQDPRFTAPDLPTMIARRRFLCPLCKALGNVLLPILWKGKPEAHPGVVSPKTPFDDALSQWQNAYNEMKIVVSAETSPSSPPPILSDGDEYVTIHDLITNSSRRPLRMPLSPFNVREAMATTAASSSPQTATAAATTSTSPSTPLLLFASTTSAQATLDMLMDGQHTQAVEALRHIYNQLLSTCKMTAANNSKRMILSLMDLHQSVIQLFDMYAYTIAAMEIAQRGGSVKGRDLTVEHTGLFLDDVSSQNQTLLKILACTLQLLPSLMEMAWVAESKHTLQRIALSTLSQVLLAPDNASVPTNSITTKPLLCDDPFRVLTTLGFATPRTLVDPHHTMRLMLVADITKAIIGLMQSLTGNEVLDDPRVHAAFAQVAQQTGQSDHDPSAMAMVAIANHIMRCLNVPAEFTAKFFAQIPPRVLVALVRTFTLPFLRKSLLLMVVHHGFIPPLPDDEKQDMDDPMQQDSNEYDRLLTVLRLPTFDQLLQWTDIESDLVSKWCNAYSFYSLHLEKVSSSTSSAVTKTTTPDYAKLLNLQLNLPTPFSLITLPYRMDQLFEESARRVCRNCKTVPEDPALCLVCGTIVCARRYCCMQDNLGECNLHMRKCGGEIGIYMVIKECLILLLHDNGATIMSAPYLDSHGEADIFLRRGKPQFLNAKRYEQLRQLWLTHSIPAFVRRRMEVSPSYQRWESW